MRRLSVELNDGIYDTHVKEYLRFKTHYDESQNVEASSYPGGVIVELPWHRFWTTHAMSMYEDDRDHSVPRTGWYDDAYFDRQMAELKAYFRKSGIHQDRLKTYSSLVVELREKLDEPIIAVAQRLKSFDWFRRNAPCHPRGRGRRGGPPQGGRTTGLIRRELPVFDPQTILFVLPDEISATLFTLRWS